MKRCGFFFLAVYFCSFYLQYLLELMRFSFETLWRIIENGKYLNLHLLEITIYVSLERVKKHRGNFSFFEKAKEKRKKSFFDRSLDKILESNIFVRRSSVVISK